MNYTTTKDSCISGFIDPSIDNASTWLFRLFCWRS